MKKRLLARLGEAGETNRNKKISKTAFHFGGLKCSRKRFLGYWQYRYITPTGGEVKKKRWKERK